MEKINIRNLYIDLLNKIKKVEGVDKDYVDDLIEVIDLHLSALDQDLSAITNVIPEDASVSNQLVPESDLEPITLDIQTLSSTVSGIGIDVSGIQAVIPSIASSSNKLATSSELSTPVKEEIATDPDEWLYNSNTGYYEQTVSLNYVLDTSKPFNVYPYQSIYPDQTYRKMFNIMRYAEVSGGILNRMKVGVSKDPGVPFIFEVEYYKI